MHAYRLKFKKEVFSFDRLMFTLTYHLEELPVEVCVMLKRQLENLLHDEEYFRNLLIETGVQDLSSVTLPAEGRMSAQIDERLATYDDQRMCSTCQHTCFLSAVCCNCSEQAVSCPKCTDQLCGCPRTNKFLLEWHSIQEIKDTITKVEDRITTGEAQEAQEAQARAQAQVQAVQAQAAQAQAQAQAAQAQAAQAQAQVQAQGQAQAPQETTPAAVSSMVKSEEQAEEPQAAAAAVAAQEAEPEAATGMVEVEAGTSSSTANAE